jgi:Tol biopolymer transport system component
MQGLAPCDLNLLFNDFKGLLFGFLTCKINKYPVRYNVANVLSPDGSTVLYAAGTPIAPEIFDATDNKWKPNPYYTSRITAQNTLTWILGADRAKTIKVGPPPKEFATTNMSSKKFYSMRWNGEVQLTDQVLLFDSNNTPSLNNYGKQLKFISELTHGYLEGERRHAFPILSKRTRPTNVV